MFETNLVYKVISYIKKYLENSSFSMLYKCMKHYKTISIFKKSFYENSDESLFKKSIKVGTYFRKKWNSLSVDYKFFVLFTN